MFKDFAVGTLVRHKLLTDEHSPGIIVGKGINPYSKKLVYHIQYGDYKNEWWEEKDIEPISYYDFLDKIKDRMS